MADAGADPRSSLAGYAIIVIAAMAIIAGGVVSEAKAREFLAHHRATGGVVTAVSSELHCVPPPGADCTTSYDTTIRYQPPGSGPRSFHESLSDPMAAGAHVRVYYLERDPGDARLDPGTNEQHFGDFLIAAGVAGLIISGIGAISDY